MRGERGIGRGVGRGAERGPERLAGREVRAPRAAAFAVVATALAPAGALAVALAVSLTAAQPARAASLFSTRGLGETLSDATGRGRALGGVSAPLADSIRVSLDNPALLGRVRLVSASAAYVVERRTAENDDASETFTDGTLPFLSAAVPFRRFVFGFGLLREQNLFVNPLVRARSETPSPYTLRFSRNGDLFRVPAALAVRIAPRLSLGASADFWFGSIDEARAVDFDSPDFRDTNDRTSDKFDGVGGTVGLSWAPNRRVALGARYRGRGSLTGDRTTTTEDGINATGPVAHTMPASFSAGATVEPRAGVRAVLEVRRDQWEGEEADAPAGARFVDATRIGAGVEMDRGGANASFLRRRPWRLGFHRADWHFEEPAGKPITEWLVTGGTSAALGGGRAAVLDIFAEFGRRGSREENGFEEKIFRFGLGFAGGEPWRKPERRGRRGNVTLPPDRF